MNSLVDYVREDFETRKARNHRYSLRAYSNYLGVNPTSLSLFLNGKRGLSEEMRARVAVKLPRLDSVQFQKLEEQNERPKEFTSMSMEKLAVLGDWHYFAILSLLETDDAKSDPEWIAARLRIPVEDVKTAIERLIRHEMLQDDNGVLRLTGNNFATPDQIGSLALRRGHYQALDLARASLDEDPLPKRSFLAMTMAIDPSRLPEAHRRIRNFNRRLCAYLEGGAKKEVYRLCVQLFPLSH